MQAVRIHEYGAPQVLRLEEAPTPEPGPGEILVRIHATSVNPVDCKARAGVMSRFRPLPLPFILGWDFSGTIAALGDGVTQRRVGDEVFGHPPIFSSGTYAEYVAVPATACARKPVSIDHDHAAAVPLTGLTAWQALFEHAKMQPGQTVLIQSGAGGVGIFAIQLAKARGIRVIATASARNLDLLRELGADEAIDYNAVRFEDVVRHVDVAIDGMAGEVRERSWKTLKPGGLLLSLTGAPPTDAMAAERGYSQKTMLVHPDGAQLEEIAALVDAGKVRPILERVFPLADTAGAHTLSETGHARGKIILHVN